MQEIVAAAAGKVIVANPADEHVVTVGADENVVIGIRDHDHRHRQEHRHRGRRRPRAGVGVGFGCRGAHLQGEIGARVLRRRDGQAFQLARGQGVGHCPVGLKNATGNHRAVRPCRQYRAFRHPGDSDRGDFLRAVGTRHRRLDVERIADTEDIAAAHGTAVTSQHLVGESEC